jgi:NhaP-type Na+/H+ and K+/H+ antiporter
VVFTAPIGAINAKRYVQGKVESYQTKDKIGQILGNKADDIDNLYNVPVASEITAQQLEVANLPKSRDILVDRLKKAVSDNKITESDAKQSLFVFDKTQQVSNAVKDLDITVDDKAKIATLLRQRDDLKTKIQNKDDVLVVQEKQQIEDINNQIEQILLKPKEGEFQEQAVVESGLTPEERIQQIETLELELKADDNVSKQGGNALSYLERTT